MKEQLETKRKARQSIVEFLRMIKLRRDISSKKFVEEEMKRHVTVCDKCFKASCWNGIFMCEESEYAGTVDKPIEELLELNLEHPSYWKKEQ